MAAKLEPHKYHGLGFTMSNESEEQRDWCVQVWLPDTYNNGFPPDHRDYRLTERTYFQVSWRIGWDEDQDDYTESGSRKVDTGAEAVAILTALHLPLKPLIAAVIDAEVASR